MGKRKPQFKKRTNLPIIDVPDKQKTRFSFEKIDLYHPEYNISKCGESFWEELLSTLREAESISFDQFVQYDHDEARHGIDFERTKQPEGYFPGFDSEQLMAFQFAVPLRRKHVGWRVYGYVVDGLFYIIWLDLRHNLWLKGEG